MKRSEQPTEYIFIEANTTSEWDSCDFAIVKLTDEWRKDILRRMQFIETIKDERDLYSVNYWDTPLGFYQKLIGDETDLSEGILKPGEQWCYITLADGEPDNFPVPENSLSAFYIAISPYGTARYCCSGKHTSEEFWTEDFNIQALTGIDYKI